jgi:hypothetical protein
MSTLPSSGGLVCQRTINARILFVVRESPLRISPPARFNIGFTEPLKLDVSLAHL